MRFTTASDMLADLAAQDSPSALACRGPVSALGTVDCARAFVVYHRKSPEQMGELEVRQFLMHLVETRKAGPASRKMHVAGIKFLYEVTLRRPEVVASIPWPKVAHGVPEILSGTEVISLLDAIGGRGGSGTFDTATGTAGAPDGSPRRELDRPAGEWGWGWTAANTFGAGG